MGFLKPQEGQVSVMGLDAWKDSCEIKNMWSMFQAKLLFQICEMEQHF